MTSNWKIWILIVAVVVVGAIVALRTIPSPTPSGQNPYAKTPTPSGTPPPTPSSSSSSAGANALPKPTSDINQTVSAFAQSSDGLSTAFANETSDTSLVQSDSQAVNDFGQAYDSTY